MTLALDLAGRRAVVTGGGSGLGREVALALGRCGAELLLVGRTARDLDAVTTELRLLGADAEYAIVDVGSAEAVERLAELQTTRPISILVNNAGIGGPVRNLIDIEPHEWDEVFNVNVRGTYLMSRALLPGMIAQGGGDIINISSVLAKRPSAGRTPYAASKLAIVALTATLAFEVGPAGVRVNCLSPGPVESDRMRRVFRGESERSGISVEQAEANFVSRAAGNRMLDPMEVGDAVIAILGMTGMTGADIDLSVGMIGR